MRILHVTPYYEEAWAYGGIPRVVSALTRGLVARGHEVTVCTTDACDADSRLLVAPQDAPGAPKVRVFPNFSNRLAYRFQFFTPRGLGRWLDRHGRGFDVAHLHGCHHLPGAIAARRLSRLGVPYVLTPNGTARRIERRGLAKWIFDHTAGRGYLAKAARILAVSEAERRELTDWGVPDARLAVVPNPLDLREFDSLPPRGSLRARFGLKDRPLILYLGTLSPRKGLDVLIAAFAALQSEEAHLAIAGNDLGSERSLRRSVHALGIEGRVKFLGLLRGQERLRALVDADVFAYPSIGEAFGLAPLEALLCGVPVIVAGDGGCGETIAPTGGGLLVPPRDPAALAQALREVLTQPVPWRRRAKRAAAAVRERYGAEIVCRRLEEIYCEVMAAPPRETAA